MYVVGFCMIRFRIVQLGGTEDERRTVVFLVRVNARALGRSEGHISYTKELLGHK